MCQGSNIQCATYFGRSLLAILYKRAYCIKTYVNYVNHLGIIHFERADNSYKREFLRPAGWGFGGVVVRPLPFTSEVPSSIPSKDHLNVDSNQVLIRERSIVNALPKVVGFLRGAAPFTVLKYLEHCFTTVCNGVHTLF